MATIRRDEERYFKVSCYQRCSRAWADGGGRRSLTSLYEIIRYVRLYWIMLFVNSRFLQRPQKRSCGNQVIHRRLSKTKSIGSGSGAETQTGWQSAVDLGRTAMVDGVWSLDGEGDRGRGWIRIGLVEEQCFQIGVKELWRVERVVSCWNAGEWLNGEIWSQRKYRLSDEIIICVGSCGRWWCSGYLHCLAFNTTDVALAMSQTLVVLATWKSTNQSSEAQPVNDPIYLAWHSEAACEARPSYHRCWLPHFIFSSAVRDLEVTLEPAFAPLIHLLCRD